ncbi:MAG: L,D-transpeptidase [bacterium]|nr:L,D-transpeptidase [bacterium]
MVRVFSASYSPYMIYVKKSKYRLFVVNRKWEVLKVLDIAVGRKENFERKVHQGDNGTPEGYYFVNEILSQDADIKSESYQKLKYMNSIYFKAKEGHFLWGKPDTDAGYRVYGPRYFGIDFPNQDDLRMYNEFLRKGLIPRDQNNRYRGQGTGLAIHGTNDPVSVSHRISSGCVRLRNEDVVLLDPFIEMGTPVYIEK